MSHGWRPTSAVIQPAVLAMYGNGSIIMSSQGRQMGVPEPV